MANSNSMVKYDKEGCAHINFKPDDVRFLEYMGMIPSQILIESLANYYYNHKETFNGLEDRMNSAQRKMFDFWKQDAIDFYTED